VVLSEHKEKWVLGKERIKEEERKLTIPVRKEGMDEMKRVNQYKIYSYEEEYDEKIQTIIKLFGRNDGRRNQKNVDLWLVSNDQMHRGR
ncbi:hypothetical protein ACLOJK_029240, partial [Asimina triloba]